MTIQSTTSSVPEFPCAITVLAVWLILTESSNELSRIQLCRCQSKVQILAFNGNYMCTEKGVCTNVGNMKGLLKFLCSSRYHLLVRGKIHLLCITLVLPNEFQHYLIYVHVSYFYSGKFSGSIYKKQYLNWLYVFLSIAANLDVRMCLGQLLENIPKTN